MSKGAVLDEAFIAAAGLGEQLLTLAGPIENRHHAILQEPMFHIRCQEIEETVYLERAYVFANQVSIRSHYGKGQKVLAWLQRSLRPAPGGAPPSMIELLHAREFFMLGDWREFQRFRQFVKSQRILDAQARQWITDNHLRFTEMSRDEAGLNRILDGLGTVAEWPDLDTQDPSDGRTSLELVAKTYSRSLVGVRAAPLLPDLLLRRAPDTRFSIFRLLSYVEDPAGPASLVRFLAALGAASGDARVAAATAHLASGRDIARAFSMLRSLLLARTLPNEA